MTLRLLKPTNTDGDPEWEAPDAGPADLWFAIYARISDAGEDAAKQQQTPGIERQVEDCERLARSLGAKRIRYYREGHSAFEGRDRPGFARLIEDVRSGEVCYVICWRTERLARRHRDFEALIDASRADSPDPAAIIHTCDGISSDTEMGRFTLRQLVSFGRWESVSIRTRVSRARQAEMEQGRFSGSPPAFGHRDGTRWGEVVPEEVALIREGAARLIAGEGVRSILRDFNVRGSRTRKGSLWQHRAWSKLLTGPRMVGAREMAGDLRTGTDDEGRPWIAPILDRETWERVRTILGDPERRRYAGGGTPKHLLTGLMRCWAAKAEGGHCGRPLSAKGQATNASGDRYWTYGCVRDAFHPFNCGGVWIKGSRTDDYIEHEVLAYLRKPGFRRALRTGLGGLGDPSQEQAELRRRRSDLQDQIDAKELAYTRGPAVLEAEFQISARTYVRWRPEAYAERDALDRRLARTERSITVRAATANPAEFWAHAALDERRELVRVLFPEIRVSPVAAVLGVSARRWDHRRIEVVPVA